MKLHVLTVDSSAIDPFLPANKKKLLLRSTVSEYDLSRQIVVYSPHSRKPLFARNLASPLKKSETFPLFEDLPRENIAPEYSPETNYFETTTSSCNDDVSLVEAARKSKSYTYIFIVLAVLASVLCTWDFRSLEQSLCADSFKDGEPDVSLVHHELKRNLFGQTAAINIITDSLTELKLTVNQMTVLVLVGGTGTGKTWTNHLIAKSLPIKVNQVSLHLEHWDHSEVLNKTVSKLKPCAWNLLYVEDSDRAESFQIKTFANFLASVRENNPSLPRKLIVIISSNMGQSELAQLLLQQLQIGGSRNSLTPTVMQQSLQGLSSSLLEKLRENKVDYIIVPYLPLEKTQLQECILQDIKLKNKLVSEETINNVMKHFRFYPRNLEYFSATGCKSVSSYVNLYV